MAALITYFSRTDQNYFGGRLKNISVGNTEQAARILEKITGSGGSAEKYNTGTDTLSGKH